LPLTLPPGDPPTGEHVYHIFAIELEERERVRAALVAEGIETAVHYPLPVHRQPVWRKLESHTAPFPSSEALARRALSLPCYPGITEGEICAVTSALRAVLDDPSPGRRSHLDRHGAPLEGRSAF
jgi:dTDP-4-amino-4,6-dideoxygalactose transaminase